MKILQNDVLIVTDVQNDFCTGGTLAVPDGDAVIPVIHRVAPLFEHIILTQDWHSPQHMSFARAHPGKRPFEDIEAGYGTQTLWPDHCVQGTRGAEFHPDLDLPQAELILRKGFHPEIDSYSAFFENDRKTATGLCGYLRERGMRRVFLVGLAYDYCVGYSALDAQRHGFEAIVIRDACRAIDLNGSVAKIEAEFARAGVSIVSSDEIRDAAAQADAWEGIRQGLEDTRAGETRPAKEFFKDFETRKGLSR
jgi:nicotinamidase/pyrazinamidase